MPAKLDDDIKRLHILAPAALVHRIDNWRGHQPDVPNLSAAIRRLIELGLKAESKNSSDLAKHNSKGRPTSEVFSQLDTQMKQRGSAKGNKPKKVVGA